MVDIYEHLEKFSQPKLRELQQRMTDRLAELSTEQQSRGIQQHCIYLQGYLHKCEQLLASRNTNRSTN